MLRKITAIVCIASVVLAGCSSVPRHAAITPIQPSSRVQLIVDLPTIEQPDAKNSSEAISYYSSRYAGQRAAEAAGSMSEGSVMACGPLFFFCLPIFMAAGAGLGATVGSVEGTAYGAKVALPEEKAIALEQLIANYLTVEDVRENIKNQFDLQQNGRWQITEAQAKVVVTLGVESLMFSQYADDQLSIRLISNLVVQYGPETSDSTKRLLLNAESHKHHVDHWIAENGVNLKIGLDNVFQESARQVIALLSQGINGNKPAGSTINVNSPSVRL